MMIFFVLHLDENDYVLMCCSTIIFCYMTIISNFTDLFF